MPMRRALRPLRRLAWTALCIGAAALAARAGPFGPGGIGVDPDHDSAQMRLKRDARVPVDACRTSDGVELGRRGVALDELLAFLDRSPSAAPNVSRFRAGLGSGRLAVAQLTDAARAEIGGGDGVMASFRYAPSSSPQILYVDRDAELGVLAVQFYHEMIHSLDPGIPAFYAEYDRRRAEIQRGVRAVYQRVADRLRKPLSEVDFGDFDELDLRRLREAKRFSNDGVYAIELRAFLAQRRFLDEMISRTPCYGLYVEQQEDRNGLHLRYDSMPDHLYRAYGLYPPVP